MINLSLIGYLGSDAKVKVLEDKKVASFSVAVTKSYKDRNGLKTEKTIWVDCSMWHGENVFPYLKKGTMVYVQGEPTTAAWSDRETGELKKSQGLTVGELHLLANKKESSTNNVAAGSVGNDDLPF